MYLNVWNKFNIKNKKNKDLKFNLILKKKENRDVNFKLQINSNIKKQMKTGMSNLLSKFNLILKNKRKQGCQIYSLERKAAM